MLKSSLDLHQCARTDVLKLVLPAASLEAPRSSVNSVRRIWNELLAKVATTHDLRQFKRLIQSPEVYAALSIRNVIRKVESNLRQSDRKTTHSSTTITNGRTHRAGSMREYISEPGERLNIRILFISMLTSRGVPLLVCDGYEHRFVSTSNDGKRDIY
uniref:Uncharacterized protein n=1 Tax=Acrobeloides nanus TaxID=290746 RepID=A0A914D261_9BILA